MSLADSTFNLSRDDIVRVSECHGGGPEIHGTGVAEARPHRRPVTVMALLTVALRLTGTAAAPRLLPRRTA